MKISNVKHSFLNFSRALTTKERIDGQNYIKEAHKILDIDNFIFTVPDQSLPVDSSMNVGLGQLNSQTSYDFLDFISSYTGANVCKVLPQGEHNIFLHPGSFFCNYATSALNLGSHLINLEDLTSDEFGNILSGYDLNAVVEANKNTQREHYANFENVVYSNSPFGKALNSAWINFKNFDNFKIRQLKREFENFKQENIDRLEPKALFETFAKIYQTNNLNSWQESDRFLYDTSFVSIDERNKRINEIKSTHKDDIEFIYFKQFLAEKSLAKAKAELNKKGIKLMGDCPVAFSIDEIWSHPKAFVNANICSEDWGLRALDFTKISDKDSDSNKLLRRKIELYAKRYDKLRMDVGWSYIAPILYPFDKNAFDKNPDYDYFSNIGGYRLKKSLGDSVLKIIEEEFKKVKGKFDKTDIIYETEADGLSFTPFDWENNEVINVLKNRAFVMSTCYMSNSYSNMAMMNDRFKVPRENYVYMNGNHDHIPLAAYARKKDVDDIFKSFGNDIEDCYEAQLEPLSNELNLDIDSIKSSPFNFISAKFAHIHLAKNIKLFFTDFFTSMLNFGAGDSNITDNFYRFQIPIDYEKRFHTALQNKAGFNVYQSLALAMRAKGLDKNNQKLYKKLWNYALILRQKGAKTEAEANKMYA